MTLSLGIIQGRLTKSPRDRLQYFPRKWDQEFVKAKEANYDYIEFFSERKFNPKNPIWNEDLITQYKKLSKKNNLKIINFCDDYIISNDVRKKKTLEYLKILLKKIQFLGAKNLILPLYGKSEMNHINYKTFLKCFKKIIKISEKKKINVLLETNVNFEVFKEFKFLLGKKIYMVFDTGNRVVKNKDLVSEILKFKSSIKLVHIKNRDKSFKNIKLRGGLVNFNEIFKALKKIKYKNNFTIESTRLKNAFYTGKNNAKMIKALIKKYL